MEENSFEFTEGFMKKINTSALCNNIYNEVILNNNCIPNVIENLCDIIDGQNDKMSELLKYGSKSTLILTNEQFSALRLHENSFFGAIVEDKYFAEIETIVTKKPFIEKVKLLSEKYVENKITMGNYFVIIWNLIQTNFDFQKLTIGLIFHEKSMDLELAKYINDETQKGKKTPDIIMSILESEFFEQSNK